MHYIYLITNLINNKVYIGQTNRPEHRWGQHKSSKNNLLISKAIRKYGADNFTFEVLIRDIDTLNKANKIEMRMIKLFNSNNLDIGYNVSPGGSALSEETRRKIGDAQKGKKISPEQLEKMKPTMFKPGQIPPNKGKKASPELLSKLSESHKGIKYSEESCIKKSESLKIAYATNPRPKKPGCSSQYKGVQKRKDGKYQARITINSERKYLGTFDTEEEAYRAVLLNTNNNKA